MIKENDILVLMKTKNGFEILNPEKIDLINDKTTHNSKKLSINFIKEAKKRLDAPKNTRFYEILLDDIPYTPNFGKIFEIQINNNEAKFQERKNWKKYIFKVGD